MRSSLQISVQKEACFDPASSSSFRDPCFQRLIRFISVCFKWARMILSCGLGVQTEYNLLTLCAGGVCYIFTVSVMINLPPPPCSLKQPSITSQPFLRHRFLCLLVSLLSADLSPELLFLILSFLFICLCFISLFLSASPPPPDFSLNSIIFSGKFDLLFAHFRPNCIKILRHFAINEVIFHLHSTVLKRFYFVLFKC